MKIKAAIILWVTITLLQACTVTRAFMYWGPNITDHKIFHHDEIYPSDQPFQFKKGNEEVLKNYIVKANRLNESDTIDMPLDDFLKSSPTTAFLVIRNDSILLERYYKGYTRDSISKFFSVSKSITSLLTGIAVDEGHIESVHDPVTKYVPELKKKNPQFEQLTIEHLLNMRAGFKFNENSYFPTSKATHLYYGTNHLGKVKRAKFKYAPGEKYQYQSLVTALLGVVVERATGKKLSQYLQEKVWTPLGMENRATWDIDDKRHRSNKAHVGVNATAIDLAKIGRLYIHSGSWNGKQIVDSGWIAKSIPHPKTFNGFYHYQWYTHTEGIVNPEESMLFGREKYLFSDEQSAKKLAEEQYAEQGIWIGKADWADKPVLVAYYNQFIAAGILNQVLFIDPKKNVIVVRLGEKEQKDYCAGFIHQLVASL